MEHPLWIGLGVSPFCRTTTKPRSQSVMANAGSSQVSSIQVKSDPLPFSNISITVLVSKITMPLSNKGGRVCL